MPDETHAITPYVDLATLGEQANQITAATALPNYQMQRSKETLRRQRRDIKLFEDFLLAHRCQVEHMADDITQWASVTYGLLEQFKIWQLNQGYAIKSINVRLATIKAYCEIANRAQVFANPNEITSIRGVQGYTKTAHRIDEARASAGIPTRKEGAKKAQPTAITIEQAISLKQQPDTEIGRRDSLIVCILLELALRCGEISRLQIKDLDTQQGRLRVYRPKVRKTQVYDLLNDAKDTYIAARLYIETLPDEQKRNPYAPLFAGVDHDHPNTLDITKHLQTRSINKRIGQLGKAIGVEKLSPHDLRHWITDVAIRNKIDYKTVQNFGGWSTEAMPLRYAHDNEIANQGMGNLPGMNVYKNE